MIESETVSVRSGTRTNTKLCEGWLEHKSHKANGHEYVRLWLVLKGNILYIFKDRDTSTESPLGSLTIDTHTKFKTEQGDSSKGYKFDLITNTKSNRFKSKKLAERELWRGYILGVASGIVPYDLDLLENQIDTIKSVITEYVTGQSGGLIRNRVSMISGSSMESHESGIVEGSLCSGFSAASGGKSVSGSDGSGGGGGPIRISLIRINIFRLMGRIPETENS